MVQVDLKNKKIEGSCTGDICCAWSVTAYHVRLSSDTHTTRFCFQLVDICLYRQTRWFVLVWSCTIRIIMKAALYIPHELTEILTTAYPRFSYFDSYLDWLIQIEWVFGQPTGQEEALYVLWKCGTSGYGPLKGDLLEICSELIDNSQQKWKRCLKVCLDVDPVPHIRSLHGYIKRLVCTWHVPLNFSTY